jgi:hypothetical protein
MEMEAFDVDTAPDRFATIDEIRAALRTLPDLYFGFTNGTLWEIASDTGGFVSLEMEDVEALRSFAKIDAPAN